MLKGKDSSVIYLKEDCFVFFSWEQYLDYLMKVLLPEMFVKIYMDVRQVDHEEASAMIQAC